MRTTRIQLGSAALLATLVLPLAARADHTGVDWDAWYDGEVRIDLQLSGGAGRFVLPGKPVRLTARANADAYVTVLAIETQGLVRVLFPSPGADDGWVEAGDRVRVGACDSSTPGLVYVQAVASPIPFDWEAAGVVWNGDGTAWCDGGPLRVQGDPLAGFNEVNRRLFQGWDAAVFTADVTWFQVGHRFEHPAYLCGVCAGRHRGYHDPWLRVSTVVEWDLVRGARHCHPVWRPLWVCRDDRRHLQRAADRTRASGDRSPSSVVRNDAARDGGREARHGVRSVELPRRGATPRSRDAEEPRSRRLETPRLRQRFVAAPEPPPGGAESRQRRVHR